MAPELVYSVMSVALAGLGFYALVVRRHIIRRLLAVNIFGSGIFVLFIALTTGEGAADPVPQAMVLTGIVVAVSATALGLVLARRIYQHTGAVQLPWMFGVPTVDDDGERD